MHNLLKFFGKVNENLTNTIGKVDYNALPYATEELSWVLWNNKRITEVSNTQHWLYEPEDESYRLVISVASQNSVKLQYIEVLEEGKGLGTTIMNCILDAADELGIQIDVFASPFKTKYANVPMSKLTRAMKKAQVKDTIRLINWYREFNFVSVDKKTPFILTYKVA